MLCCYAVVVYSKANRVLVVHMGRGGTDGPEGVNRPPNRLPRCEAVTSLRLKPLFGFCVLAVCNRQFTLCCERLSHTGPSLQIP